MLVEVATRPGSGSEPVMPMPPQPASAPAASRIAPRRPDVMVVCVIGSLNRSAGLIIANRARFVVFREPVRRSAGDRPGAAKSNGARSLSPARARCLASPALSRSAPAAEAGSHRFRLAGDQAFALRPLARELAGTADRLRPFARLLLRGFFVMAAKLHLAEDALALHLLLERLEGLVDVIVPDENLHASFLLRSSSSVGRANTIPAPRMRRCRARGM